MVIMQLVIALLKIRGSSLPETFELIFGILNLSIRLFAVSLACYHSS